jgi:hypothetical protein
MRSTERIGWATACVCIVAAFGTGACGKRVVLGTVVGNSEDSGSVAPDTSGSGAFNILDAAMVPASTREEDAAGGDAAGGDAARERGDSMADDGESDDDHGESDDSSDEHAEESETERSEDDEGSGIEDGSESEETRDTAEAERWED